MLYEGEQSVHDLLVVVRNQLESLAEIDERFTEAAAECGSAEAIVSELAKFIQGYNARVEFNPERLEELRERLGRLALLKKKYGGSLESILQHREEIGQEVALAENFEEVIAAPFDGSRKRPEGVRGDRPDGSPPNGMISPGGSSRRSSGSSRSSASRTASSRRISRSRRYSSVRFRPHVKSGRKCIALNPRGYDHVEFLISTNLGEEPKPLVRVASGGEVSRIMLALKSILAKSDRLPVLIFDEIDVGVSGRVAQAVGLSLKNLSGFHQVIAITHLPQIAGLADTHFAVYKTEDKGRATTSIRRLTLDEQVREVAKLMSGAEVTEAGLDGARELMGLKRDLKHHRKQACL